MTKGRKTTFEERVEIVQYCIAHNHNYAETAENHRVSYQQAVLTAGFQSTVAGANAGMPVMPSPANGNGNGRIKQGHTAEAVLGESAEEEPEDNEFLDYSFGV